VTWEMRDITARYDSVLTLSRRFRILIVINDILLGETPFIRDVASDGPVNRCHNTVRQLAAAAITE